MHNGRATSAIDKVVFLCHLLWVWLAFPDLRFGQLLHHILGIGTAGEKSLVHIEDEALLKAADAFEEEFRQAD